MVNWLAPGGDAVVAVSVRSWLVPSGSVKVYFTVSPSLGLAGPRSTPTVDGVPAGPITVAPVRFDVTPAILKPNGEIASSATSTSVALGAEITNRPSPLVPRSAA